MPRDGSGNYTLPYPAVVDGTTIESAVHNGTMSDIALQLNGPVPIVAGGTGANNAHDAMIALSGEIADQIVTNYDSHPFVSGSFKSEPGATGAPNAGNVFFGTCCVYNTNAIVLEARIVGDGSATPTTTYIRQKYGTWGPWFVQPGSVADLDARYVNLTGDTMTGALNVNKDSTNLKWQLLSNLAFYGSLTSDPGNGQVGIGFLAEKSGVTWKNGSTTLAGSYIASSVGGNPIGCVVNNVGTPEANFAPGLVGWVVKADGSFNVPSSVTSTSPTTGALTVAGGVGVGGALITGANVYPGAGSGLGGFYLGAYDATHPIIAFEGGHYFMYDQTTHGLSLIMGSTGCGWTETKYSIDYTTASSSPTTGALTVAGGVGISKQLNVGGTATATLAHQIGASDASFANIAVHCSTGNIEGLYSASTASVALGAYSNHPLEIRSNNVPRINVSAAGIVNIPGTTAATAYNAGALTCAGGVGVTGDIWSAGRLTLQGNGPYNLPGSNICAKIAYAGGGTTYGLGLRPAADSTVAVHFSNSVDTIVGTIFVTASTTAYNTTSDGRLKEDLKSFDAGNVVDQTEVYDFAWKTTGERSYGVIAQQAMEVYPAAVTYLENEDWYGVDYSKYVPVLLQELKALRARVAALEGGATIGTQPAKRK